MTWLRHAVSSDWKVERNVRRRRERALPAGLRADVRRVRRDDLAQEILDVIEARLQLEARRGQSTEDITSKGEIIPVVARKLLRGLDTNRAFRGFIRNEIDKVLRTHHITKITPNAAEIWPKFGPAPQPDGSLLTLRSSIGLETASYLEAEPEEWCHYVASNAIGRVLPPGLGDDVTLEDDPLRMFVIGAGPGGVARAVTALELPIHIRVYEYDYVLPEPTAMPCVGGRRELRDQKHDIIAMVLPSPGVGGAANQRQIYQDGCASQNDPSGFGPKKWLAYAEVWLALLPELMMPNAEAFLLVPASVRCGSQYRQHEALVESVLRACNTAGLEVVERLRVVEVDPVNQPFVGRNRPERWSLRVRRRSSSGAAEVRDA